MRKILISAFFLVASATARALPPNENLVKSCLSAQSASPSIAIHILESEKISQEEDYAGGFNATYMFDYRGAYAGYAEGKAGQALIYSGKLFRLSRALALGNNRGIKPSAFDPTLAQWSIVEGGGHKFFCVSFNFDGLGRSGSFQSVHGGYLLDTERKNLYFFVRNIKR